MRRPVGVRYACGRSMIRTEIMTLSAPFSLHPFNPPTGSPDRVGRRSSRRATGKDASPEKRALERAIAVHSAATKSCGFTSRIHTRQRLSVGLEHTRVEV